MKLPDLHLLQAAIMLAEVRNYSRAARRLGIQQPTLTKRILELEHLIGFPIFLRTTQFVEPTEACRQFIEEAKQCVFHAERAMHAVRVAERGAHTVLHVGKSQYTDPYLISLLTTVSLPLYPDLEISLSSMTAAELETEVLVGGLDLAVAIGNFDNPKITQSELMSTPLYVVMAEKNVLAAYRELSLPLLSHKSWLLFERHMNAPLYDTILREAHSAGVQPRSVHHVATAEEAAQELYADIGEVAFFTRSSAWRIARNGLTLRPLLHPEFVLSTKLIARADNESRIVSEFARFIRGSWRYPHAAN